MTVKIGIVGAGHMGTSHARILATDKQVGQPISLPPLGAFS